ATLVELRPFDALGDGIDTVDEPGGIAHTVATGTGRVLGADDPAVSAVEWIVEHGRLTDGRGVVITLRGARGTATVSLDTLEPQSARKPAATTVHRVRREVGAGVCTVAGRTALAAGTGAIALGCRHVVVGIDVF